jgi:hypothetical protein
MVLMQHISHYQLPLSQTSSSCCQLDGEHLAEYVDKEDMLMHVMHPHLNQCFGYMAWHCLSTLAVLVLHFALSEYRVRYCTSHLKNCTINTDYGHMVG